MNHRQNVPDAIVNALPCRWERAEEIEGQDDAHQAKAAKSIGPNPVSNLPEHLQKRKKSKEGIKIRMSLIGNEAAIFKEVLNMASSTHRIQSTKMSNIEWIKCLLLLAAIIECNNVSPDNCK